MHWLDISLEIMGAGLGLVLIVQPVWLRRAVLRRGEELADSKRGKLKDCGWVMLGAAAIIAWDNLLK
jgi:hypothetical protein